ncbi:MAG: TlpA family protein disulfide reductase [bacterium]|nr:TlpA family protein disulfide reductase [bacterium]
MKYQAILLLTFISTFGFAQETTLPKLKKGRWVAGLQLNENDVLPFEMEVEKVEDSYQFYVVNGDEMIKMQSPEFKNDSLFVRFPYFNSELVFVADGKKSIHGYWQNFNKKNYTIPFTAERSKKNARFSETKKKADMLAQVDGKWEVTFGKGSDSEYPAVGIFNQEEEVITGTFLTETGDYRFLAGNVTEDSLYLSCFDGSHAFLFKAKKNGNELEGTFFSGSHWSSSWMAKPNAQFELTSPEDLTFIEGDSTVAFRLSNLEGKSVIFPNSSTEGKVVIIQIMGTWCPNCLDETMYYKKLSERYKDQGLEIISVCYEAGDTFEEHKASIERLKNNLDLDFTFVVGGSAKKSLASRHFSMLNEVISFPTSIFIGRDGSVKRVHTGFNGPGTGEIYTQYVEETNALIEFLLAQ